MDRSAILEIQASQAIQTANTAIPDTHVPVVSLPSDYTIHNMEKYLENRCSFRGALNTKCLTAFAAYANEHSQDGAACFINADAMDATLVFDLGNREAPGHCTHTATLKTVQSSAYADLLKFVDQRKTQKDIAEFIEDWRHQLTASRDLNEDGSQGEAVSIVRAIHAVRKINIEAKVTSENSVSNFGASAGTMESIDVVSADMPPAYFHFTCDPYQGLPARTFDLRLSVITERAPALVLRIVRHDEHKEEMAKQFQGLIEDSLADITPEIKTYIGNFKY